MTFPFKNNILCLSVSSIDDIDKVRDETLKLFSHNENSQLSKLTILNNYQGISFNVPNYKR
jgi:hypothetical protein